MKNLLTILLSVITLMLNAQSFVDTTQQNKNIILEEFTGIGCVWCPAGHLIGQNLHNSNPNDVFLINIHTSSKNKYNPPKTLIVSPKTHANY